MSLRRSSPTSSADETLEDKLLRAVAREVQENTRAIASVQQPPPSPPPPGCCTSTPSSLVRGLSRRVFGTATGSSARSSPTQRTLPRSPPRGQASSDVTGTSGSAPGVAARTGSEEEAKPEQEQAALTRSDYGAMMRSALANIQEDGEGQEQVPFTKMEEAMTGFMELAYGKAELPNPPELPREFASRWPHDDGDLSHSGVMDDPVILASGYSVDRSYHRWFCQLDNICPITNKTLSHSSTAPNHLLGDMLAAWHLDHMTHSPASNADKLSIPVTPSVEQIQDILQKFSEHPVMQEEALHEIQLLSKISKGEQPCLQRWPGLLPELIDLQKNWKSTWKQNLEEERLGVILNLSVHRPNREILVRENRLPVALKEIVTKLHKHGSPASAFAKVASIVAILSEFDMFRKGILDIGGMEMLRDLLKIEDAVVRKEAVTAIRGLCTDEEGKTNAQSYNVSDVLLECLTVSDEVLLLLDCLPKDPCMVDKMSEKAVDLVNIIMAGQGTGPVTPEVTCSAISLVHAIVQRDAHKMGQVKNLEDFKERLMELSSGRLPMQTMLQVDTIINSSIMQFW
ncbi:hypothetical protein SETIT_1G162200v2 [Setaria italica]|uniref:RING-type E3 ubiquitin transferase n=1 Tax=Setaria italica TaxID=4555 RepID=K3YYF1_SETIT|nr:U-box domain-containing protein 73 [Setaria italica]RCV06438.1 hypothetical protein SETIT_1G162200v2 [Setaria italica]